MFPPTQVVAGDYKTTRLEILCRLTVTLLQPDEGVASLDRFHYTTVAVSIDKLLPAGN